MVKLILRSITALLVLSFSLHAAELEAEKLDRIYSPQTAQTFHNIACDILEPEYVSVRDAKEAIVLIKAAHRLDETMNNMLPQLLDAVEIDEETDHSDFVKKLLYRYVTASSDSELAMRGISYLLNQAPTRERREEILDAFNSDIGSTNEQFSSRLSTFLGSLIAETGDFKRASRQFKLAYEKDPYNVVAFEKLSEIDPESVNVVNMGPYLRRKIVLDPYSLELTLDFADYAFKYGLFKIARDTYEYAADLFVYENPDQKIPQRVYMPWVISAYNVEHGEAKCIKIINRIRQQGDFNIYVEYISIMSEPLSRSERMDKLSGLAETGEQMLETNNPMVTEQQLAFFYFFLNRNTQKGIEMAKRAYARNADSVDVRALYAYSLFESGDMESAKQIVEEIKTYNQIAAYTGAMISLEENNESEAMKLLRSCIEMQPGELISHKAKEVMRENESNYVPAYDAFTLRQNLEKAFGDSLIPKFYRPEDVITTKLSLNGVEFSYGAKLGLYVIITNNGRQPIVVNENAFFKGNILVKAKVAGDIEGAKPIEIRKKITPVSPIRPGGTLAVPMPIKTAAPTLDRILERFPQANLVITFQAYFDSYENESGELASKIVPATTTAKRLGVVLTEDLLEKRIQSLQEGYAGQKINTLRLLNGLVAERKAAKNYGVVYKRNALPDSVLKEAFDISLADMNWQVKFLMLNVLRGASDLLDAKEKFSNALDDDHWPVRLLSLYALTNIPQSSDFQKVIDWMYQADEQELIRKMALIAGAVPEAAEEEY
ncbi:hypothetical protein STSP1_00435 [Sedimentisphaera salicampi]|uniref:Uncharacterized protein n=1 Tax=Sedimentisphaera salicampi TaxID=1941349 RepID=A0A1W6LJY1_9BACT|nr:hypothetical protein STSP1_00435 [Sedimentisphaera salicampi]